MAGLRGGRYSGCSDGLHLLECRGDMATGTTPFRTRGGINQMGLVHCRNLRLRRARSGICSGTDAGVARNSTFAGRSHAAGAADMKSEPLIESRELTKIYLRGHEQVRALDTVSFQIARGEFVAVVGPSGSGKTTLLNLLGCMDSPSSGSLRIGDAEVSGLDYCARTRLRRDKIGFVF